MTTSSFTYHFRPSARSGRNKGSIFLRVIHDRKSFSISLGLYVYPEEWDSTYRTVIVPARVSLRHDALKQVRDSLDASLLHVERILSDLQSQGSYTAGDIREKIRGTHHCSSLSCFVDALAAEITPAQERTARAYRSTLNSVVRFNQGRDIRLTCIHRTFVEAYEAHLKTRGLHMNTVSFYMRNLRSVYNRAVRAGLIPPTGTSPFRGVFTGMKKTEKKALDPIQINSLIKLDPTLLNFRFGQGRPLPGSLRDSLAMFLFAFFAQGMSFVDLAYLRKEDIRGGVIRYHRKKTGQYIEVTLCREMKSLISYFSRRTVGSPYVFPIISSCGKSARRQYESALRLQNLRLKKLSAITPAIDKTTTHAARHSWATIAKNEKIEISVISEALGHNNEATTRIYLDSFKKQLLDKANERIRRAIKKAV